MAFGSWVVTVIRIEGDLRARIFHEAGQGEVA